METLKVTRKQAKSLLERTFPDYNGRKFRVRFAETVTFYDLNYSGGTRNEYAAVKSDGESVALDGFNRAAPWNNPAEGSTVRLPVDVAIVEHSDFCGRDLGITIYLHPANASKWLADATDSLRMTEGAR